MCAAPARARTVLIADDDPAARRPLERYMAKKGLVVLTASNGQEALVLLRTRKPDLILLDINMPIMSGLEILKLIRETAPRLPVIIVTGDEDMETVKQAITLGASDFLKKPIDLTYLDSSPAWLQHLLRDD